MKKAIRFHHRLLPLVSLGAALEYYDFVVYTLLSPYLNKLFFLNHGSSLHTFGFFSAGYLARPFGGILFGSLGDHFGRKRTFVGVMLLMAVSTLLIGISPTSTEIGKFAGPLLLLLRFLQGLSFGGELPGAITLIAENTPQHAHGQHCGIVMSSVAMGSVLASLLLQFLTSTFTEQQIMAGAWRIPFILGGLLAVVSFLIRKNQLSSHVNKKTHRSQIAILELIQNYSLETAVGLLIALLPASLVMFILYAPEYLSNKFNFKLSDIYFSITLGTLWSILFLPLFGILSDKIHHRKVLIYSASLFCLCIFPLIKLLYLNHFLYLLIFILSLETFITIFVTSHFPFLVALFPQKVRYTGIALCYNLAYVLASLSPGLFGYADHKIFAYYFFLACAVILTSLTLNKQLKHC